MKLHQIVRQKTHSAARLLHRAREVRAARGSGEMIAFVRNAMKGFTPPWITVRAVPIEFDRVHGVDTSGIVRIASMEISSANYVHGVFYKGTDPERLRALLSRLPIEGGNFTFIDIGSGKGRALLIASEFPFRRILGVEYAADLHRIAEENIRCYRGSRRCPDIRSVCMDAADYDFPDDPLMLYFYEPFALPVLEIVLGRLRRSYKESFRPIVVLYHHAPSGTILSGETARCELLFSNCGFLLPVAACSDDANVVYATAEAMPMLQPA